MDHRTIKMKPVDIKLRTHVDLVGDHTKILKYVFEKGYTPNWLEVFVTKKGKNVFPCTYIIGDLMDHEIVARFYEKVTTKGKDDKLYVRWKFE